MGGWLIPIGWERQTGGELERDDMCWCMYQEIFILVRETTPYPGEGYGRVSDYHCLIRLKGKCST